MFFLRLESTLALHVNLCMFNPMSDINNISCGIYKKFEILGVQNGLRGEARMGNFRLEISIRLVISIGLI